MRSRGGASWQLVDRALAREFTLLLSVPLVLQYEAVLTREEHRKVHRLSVPELDEVINSLVRVGEAVPIRFLWRPLLSDPADDMVLENRRQRSGRSVGHLQPKRFRGCTEEFCAEDIATVRSAASVTGACETVTQGEVL
jgi:hypothetical protein